MSSVFPNLDPSYTTDKFIRDVYLYHILTDPKQVGYYMPEAQRLHSLAIYRNRITSHLHGMSPQRLENVLLSDGRSSVNQFNSAVYQLFTHPQYDPDLDPDDETAMMVLRREREIARDIIYNYSHWHLTCTDQLP